MRRDLYGTVRGALSRDTILVCERNDANKRCIRSTSWPVMSLRIKVRAPALKNIHVMSGSHKEKDRESRISVKIQISIIRMFIRDKVQEARDAFFMYTHGMSRVSF